MPDARSWLQQLPQVDALLRRPELDELRSRLAHDVLVAIARDVLAATRKRIQSGEDPAPLVSLPALIAQIEARAAAFTPAPLRRVINATGVLIHTNLGRAPLSAGAQQAVASIYGGYCNLEMDLESGSRTSRLGRVRELLQQLTGAEDALAVNNNAAAVFLALHVLAAGREAIVSRGELVEIGGSFRLPDIMAASGAVLREVGTTNRTRLEDYARAISPRTGLILKVHPSNFVVEGFAESVALEPLARLAREKGVPLLADVGSGALTQHPPDHLRDEPRIQDALAAGCDLVCASGDKLLGGPQAGILLGRAEIIDTLRRHPLARVLRLDKLHLAALEATILEYLGGTAGLAAIPLYRLMQRDAGELRALAQEISERMCVRAPAGWRIAAIETRATMGGGSLPGETLPSAGIEISHLERSMDELARRLRLSEPALVGRIERDRLILDLRAVLEDELPHLEELLIGALTAVERGYSRKDG